MNYLTKSRLYEELKWKYLEKKIKPFVFLFLILMTAWITNMMWATAELVSNLVYYVR